MKAPESSTHVPALDGVRGVAILLVLAMHMVRSGDSAGLATPVLWMAKGGWMGVDVFFTLSGFLITGILLETRGARGYWWSFYARRALRIWPLYLLVIGALACVATWAPQLAPKDAADFHRVAPWIWTQTVNLRSALGNNTSGWPYGVGIYWSLGVEEQFYLVWPLVIAVLAPRRLALGCCVLAVGSFILRLVLANLGMRPGAVYVFPVTHLEGLALGSALAATVRDPRAATWVRRQVAGLAAHPWRIAGLAAVLLAAVPKLAQGVAARGQVAREPVAWAIELTGFPLASLVTAIVIAGVVTAPVSPLARALAAPWLRWVGKVSYGIYVLHVPALVFVPILWPWLPDAAYGVAVLAVTFALAWVSWKWWEGPWLRLKRYVPRPVPHPTARPAEPAARRAS